MSDVALWLYEHRYLLAWIGFNLTAAGCVGLWLTRKGLILGPDPELPPVVVVDHPLGVEPEKRIDSDTEVITRVITPHIPGAGPVCPTCGGPFGSCSCFNQKERTEEPDGSALTVRIPPYAPTWPQFPRGLEPHDTVVLRQLPGPTVAELDDLAAKHRAPEDDCPLTTDEISIPDDEPLPLLAATVRGDTVDLGAKTQKIRAVAS